MTDVIFVAIGLVIAAIGVLIWYAVSKRGNQQNKQLTPWTRFFVTVIALINSFIVLVMSVGYFHGAIIGKSLSLAILLLLLGVFGIVFAYIGRFKRTQLTKKVK